MVELRALLARCRQGDAGALPRLRAVLDAHPDVTSRLGDLAGHAEAAWIDLACGPDLGVAEMLRRQIAALKAGLVGPAPGPIERLLAERVAATWLQVHWADAAAARQREASVGQAELSLKRQDAAHRRHLAALAALATVQRLLPAAKGPGAVAIPGRSRRDACDVRDAAPAGVEAGPGPGPSPRPDEGRVHGIDGPTAPVLFDADGGDRARPEPLPIPSRSARAV